MTRRYFLHDSVGQPGASKPVHGSSKLYSVLRREQSYVVDAALVPLDAGDLAEGYRAMQRMEDAVSGDSSVH